jgi:hypothetical protein
MLLLKELRTTHCGASETSRTTRYVVGWVSRLAPPRNRLTYVFVCRSSTSWMVGCPNTTLKFDVGNTTTIPASGPSYCSTSTCSSKWCRFAFALDPAWSIFRRTSRSHVSPSHFTHTLPVALLGRLFSTFLSIHTRGAARLTGLTVAVAVTVFL